MMDYTIKLNITESVAQRCIDSAVHSAISRFEVELGENAELVNDIAHAAAASALEQFKAWCNNELRLIAIEHERIAKHAMLKTKPLQVQLDQLNASTRNLAKD